MVQATLVVDIVELQRRTGTRRPVRADLALSDTEVGDRSVVGGLLAGDVVVEAATEGIVVSGNERIDLVPVVRELALLALPLAPLCRDDCTGPDTDRFPTGPAEGTDGPESDEPQRDPRWAALDALAFDDVASEVGEDHC